MENGFQGKEGQTVPEMTPAYCESVSERYIELYENIAGEKFVKADNSHVAARIERNIQNYITHHL
jgi:phosphoribosylaminoimidazole-succinocarboxamide synthase